MAFEHRENSGTMFENSYKKSDKHPDLKGQANVNGELMDVAGWWKETSNGKQMLSLSFQEPREKSDGDDDTVI